MLIQASAGRDRKTDLRDFCYKLTLTVGDLSNAEEEGELLSRLYRELANEKKGFGPLLGFLRSQQGRLRTEHGKKAKV